MSRRYVPSDNGWGPLPYRIRVSIAEPHRPPFQSLAAAQKALALAIAAAQGSRSGDTEQVRNACTCGPESRLT